MKHSFVITVAPLLLAASCSTLPAATQLPPALLQMTPSAQTTFIASPTTAPALPTTQAQEGVTLTIVEVRAGEGGTGITLQIQVDPSWQFDPDPYKTPPQQALIRDLALSDETGNIYAPRSRSGGLPEPDLATGGVKYEYNIAFEPVSPQAQVLTLEVTVELSEIPADQPLTLTTANHQLGAAWDLDQAVTVFGIPIQIKSVRFLTADNILLNGTPQPLPTFEFTSDAVEQGGLQVSCLRITPSAGLESGANDCVLDKKQIVSSVSLNSDFGSQTSIQFNVTGNITLTKPFQISWPVTNK